MSVDVVTYQLSDTEETVEIYFESRDGEAAYGARSRRNGEKPIERFETAFEAVKPVMNFILGEMKKLAQKPSEIELEFGLGVESRGNLIFAQGSTNANIKVKLIWKREEPSV